MSSAPTSLSPSATPASSTTLTVIPSTSTAVTPAAVPLIKKPPPKGPEILEEDAYVQAVSDIIERDFFPNLKKMKVQNELLEAVHNGEYAKAKALRVELERIKTGDVVDGAATPSNQRYGSETPKSFISQSPALTATPSEDPPSQPEKFRTNMSLDAFQSKYTSEDNASFSEIVERANEQKKEKYRWVYDKETNQLKLEGGQEQKLLANGADVKMIEGMQKPVDTWKYSAKNSLMYYPAGAPPSLAEIIESRGPPKAIAHTATRFDPVITTDQLVNASQAEERLRTQEVWKSMAKATPALFPNRSDISDSPKVAGFGFVPSTPALNPDDDVDPSELMTWGMIEGTPLLVDSGGDHSGRGFRMPDTPKREVIGMKLSEKASKSLRQRTTGRSAVFASPRTPLSSAGSRTPRGGTPSLHRVASPFLRSNALSPAAKQLLGRSKTAAANLLRASGADAQLRASYSRTPARSIAGTPRIEKNRAVSVSPMIRGGTNAGRQAKDPAASLGIEKDNREPRDAMEDVQYGTTNARSLTDNLLQL